MGTPAARTTVRGPAKQDLPAVRCGRSVSAATAKTSASMGGLRTLATYGCQTRREGGSRHSKDPGTACCSALPQGSSEPLAALKASTV